MSQPNIESTLIENRLFHPSAEFSQNAHIKSLEHYQQLCAKAKADRVGWAPDMVVPLESTVACASK